MENTKRIRAKARTKDFLNDAHFSFGRSQMAGVEYLLQDFMTDQETGIQLINTDDAFNGEQFTLKLIPVSVRINGSKAHTFWKMAWVQYSDGVRQIQPPSSFPFSHFDSALFTERGA